MNGRVLVVDDEPSMCDLVATDLRLRDYEVVTETDPKVALRRVSENEFQAVITDLKMPGMSGTELCKQLVQAQPELPVIVMTGFGSMETAVEAIRAGAYDFVTKPLEMQMLALTVERAVGHFQLQQRVRLLSRQLEQTRGFGDLLGESNTMTKLYDQLSRVVDTDTTVLITGESGTGKELVARGIHQLSSRRDGPFVAVNCAALPESLLESELFGHAQGAFTDAQQARKGLFLQAQGGTLFLDEIGDFPLAMQSKLLRVLEEQQIRPVGADQEVPIDVRIVSATHRDLESEVEEGNFREDLFFRVHVINIELPPLRARGSDILLLAQHFVQIFAERMKKSVTGLSEEVASKLLSYAWPGNVRELRNAIERAVALTRFDHLTVDDLPDRIREHRSNQVWIGGEDPSELVPLAEVERRYIEHVLQAVNNNKTQAARILSLDRKTLYRKLKESAEED